MFLSDPLTTSNRSVRQPESGSNCRTRFLFSFHSFRAIQRVKNQNNLEQIAVYNQYQFSFLQLGQAFCNRQTQPAALGAAGRVAADEPLQQFLSGNIERRFGNVAKQHTCFSVMLFQIQINPSLRLRILTDVAQ